MPVFEIGLEDGRTLQIDADSQQAALAGVQHFIDGEKPSGVAAGVQKGVSDLIRGPAETIKQYFGANTDGVKKAAEALAPKNYKSAPLIPENGHWYDPTSYNWSNLPQNIAEAAPGMAQDILLARTVGKANKLAGLAAGVASYLTRTRGDVAKQDAAIRTGDQNAEPNTEDKVRSGLTGLAEAVPTAIGLGRFLPGGKVSATVGTQGVLDSAKKLATTAGVEAGVGGAQSAIGQAGATVGTPSGLHVDPNELVSAALTSGATGGLIASPRAASEARQAVKFREFGGNNADASAAFANRVKDAADGANIGNVREAYQAVRTATDGVKNELSDAVSALKKTTQIGPDADNALDRATKGQQLTARDLSRIETAVQGAPNGNLVVDLARQAHVSAMLREQGRYGANGKFAGGISGAMEDSLRPIYNPMAALASTAASALGAHALPGMIGMYAPHVVGGVYGAYGLARILDRLNGTRSPAKTFANKFADNTTPVRQNVVAPAAPGRLVQPNAQPVNPPAGPGQPWGVQPGVQVPVTPPTEPPAPNVNQMLRANAAVQSGITKIVQQLQNDKRKQMVQEASPLLRKLAETQGPNASTDVELPAGFTKSQVASGGPVDLPNPLAKPAVAQPDAFPILPKEMTQRAKLLVSALERVKNMRETAIGKEQADQIAAQSPLLDEVGGLSAVSNPAVGKRASQLVSATNAIKKLTAAPAETDVPVAPVIDKITKKANGKVEAKARANGVDEEFVPLAADKLWRNKLNDEAVASRELSSYKPAIREKYRNNVMQNRAQKRDILERIAEAHDEDAAIIGELYHQLDHISRRAEARRAIKFYTNKMTPEAAQAVRSKLNATKLGQLWRQE